MNSTERRLLRIRERKNRDVIALTRFEDASPQFVALRQLAERSGDSHPELEFIPIRLVTIIEVVFRNLVSVLVDQGHIYRERAAPLLKSVKFDLPLAMALTDRDVSIGDVVAHEVPVNSLEDIARVAEMLFEKKLALCLSESRRFKGFGELEHVLKEPEETLRTIADLFKTRHILTHELSKHRIFSREDAGRFCDAAERFTEALDAFFSQQMWWNKVEHWDDYRKATRAGLAEAERRLTRLVAALTDVYPKDRQLIHDTQSAWRTFAEYDARLGMLPVEAGEEIVDILISSALSHSVDDRCVEIQHVLEEAGVARVLDIEED